MAEASMLKDVSPDDKESARAYDTMIPWEKRLAREVPLIKEFLRGGLLLDVACATGRHSLALSSQGFTTVGIDISGAMVAVSEENAAAQGASCRFHTMDAASRSFVRDLGDLPLVYDAALMVGNAIANTGSLEKVKLTLDNIFSVVRPGGRLLMQTINRPRRPHYLPLRNTGEFLLQRIMIPVYGAEHNVELNVNVIDADNLEYANQGVSELYMVTYEEFEEVVTAAGWVVKDVFSSYSKDSLDVSGGRTVVWLLERPPLELTPETRELFPGLGDREIEERAVSVWERAKRVSPYRFVLTFRFLYPRVMSYPNYSDILEGIEDKSILDIGCAFTTDLRHLQLRGAKDVTGLDITDGFFKLGEELFGEFSGRFLVGDLWGAVDHSTGERVDFEQFDLVLAGSVLHLLPREDVSKFLTRVRELLAPGGMFVARTVGSSSSTSEGVLRSVFTVEELKELASSAGFGEVSVVEMEREGIPRPSDRRTFNNLALICR